jgi:hypothetical protein
MNPHWLFMAIMTLSVSVAILNAITSGSTKELLDMAAVLGVAATCMGFALLATKRYWQGARWLR